MDVDAVQHVLARRGLVQHADNVHQRGLTGTGLAHDGNELAGVDGQVDTVQNFQLVRLADVVALADALHLDQGLRGVRGLLPYQAPGNILRKLLCFFRHY